MAAGDCCHPSLSSPAFLATATFRKRLQGYLQLSWLLMSLGPAPTGLFWSQAPLPACGAWQSPRSAPETSLGTETEQGMRLAPEPAILALQTYGRDQRVRLDNFSQPYLIPASLRLYRHLQWGCFPGQAAQTARDLKRRHGWRCPTAKWPFPAQIIGKRKTKRCLAKGNAGQK